jgi:hypothetical protein
MNFPVTLAKTLAMPPEATSLRGRQCPGRYSRWKHKEHVHLLLLMDKDKDEQEDLTNEERKALRKIVEAIKQE